MWAVNSCFAFFLASWWSDGDMYSVGHIQECNPSIQPPISLLFTYSFRSKHLSTLFLSHLTVYPHKTFLKILSCGPSHTARLKLRGAAGENPTTTRPVVKPQPTRSSAFPSNRFVGPWYPLIPKDCHFRPSSLSFLPHSPQISLLPSLLLNSLFKALLPHKLSVRIIHLSSLTSPFAVRIVTSFITFLSPKSLPSPHTNSWT